MRQFTTSKFRKQYKRLPRKLQIKFKKQVEFFLRDYHHPSLRTKKVSGKEYFEARIDYHNRFTYEIEEGKIIFLSIGPHDEGLGKK